jgi:hypothetical protein
LQSSAADGSIAVSGNPFQGAGLGCNIVACLSFLLFAEGLAPLTILV